MADHFAHLSTGALTDVGSRRKNNEDSILTLPEHGVFCVADGMGGVQGGEVASQAVVTFLTKAYDKLDGPEAAEPVVEKAQIIDRALNAASTWVKRRSDKKGIKGCGTTAVVLAFDGRNPRHAMILHAGDSRAYRYRDGQLEQLSQDHTVAAAAGLEDDSELPAMFRGVVTRAVGVKARVEVEKTPVQVEIGDVYLLASDGLDKMVSDPEIQARIDGYADGEMQDLAQVLVDDANRNGGVDNVSVILVRVNEGAGEPAATDGEVRKEAERYLAEDERRREMGVVDAGEDGERDSGEGDTPPSGSLEGVTPSRGSWEDDSDTDDRAVPSTGPLARSWRKWLGLPIGLRYAFGLAVVAFLALVIAQVRRGQPSRSGGSDGWDPGTPLSEAHREIEVGTPDTRGPRIVPVLLPEEGPSEPEVELTPEERQAQVDQMLQELDTPAPGEEAPAGEPSEEETAEPGEPEDPVERARLEQVRQRREREEREAQSPRKQAEVRAALPGKIEEALTSGRWGALDEHVAYWEPYIDGLVDRSGRALVYQGWLEVWEQARTQPDAVGSQLQTYEAEMKEILEVCGFQPPTPVNASLGESAEERADLYCARRHELQTGLAVRTRAFADLHARHSALFPGDPGRAFRNFWLFSGQTDTSGALEAARRLADGRAELDRLKTWLAVRTDEPFPAAELGMVPLGSVPVIREQFDALWADLYEVVVNMAPQLDVWRAWEDATLAEQLDTLSKLQKDVVLSRQSYGDDLAAWRTSANHEAMSRLLTQVDKVYPLLRRKIDAAKR